MKRVFLIGQPQWSFNPLRELIKNGLQVDTSTETKGPTELLALLGKLDSVGNEMSAIRESSLRKNHLHYVFAVVVEEWERDAILEESFLHFTSFDVRENCFIGVLSGTLLGFMHFIDRFEDSDVVRQIQEIFMSIGLGPAL